MSRATSAMRTVAIGAEQLGGARLGARHQSLMRPQPGTPGIEACAANAGARAPSAARRSLLDLAVFPPSLLPGYGHNGLRTHVEYVFKLSMNALAMIYQAIIPMLCIPCITMYDTS